MPNWAWGYMAVTGKKESVLAFSKHIITEDTEDAVRVLPNTDVFYRSFHSYRREDMENSIMSAFNGKEPDEETEVELEMDFAWSAISCLVLHADCKGCIALDKACIDHQVDVHVRAEEPGMGFAEEIWCDREGGLEDKELDLKSGRCRHCGNIESLCAFDDPAEQECSECGGIGFDLVEGDVE